MSANELKKIIRIINLFAYFFLIILHFYKFRPKFLILQIEAAYLKTDQNSCPLSLSLSLVFFFLLSFLLPYPSPSTCRHCAPPLPHLHLCCHRRWWCWGLNCGIDCGGDHVGSGAVRGGGAQRDARARRGGGRRGSERKNENGLKRGHRHLPLSSSHLCFFFSLIFLY